MAGQPPQRRLRQLVAFVTECRWLSQAADVGSIPTVPTFHKLRINRCLTRDNMLSFIKNLFSSHNTPHKDAGPTQFDDDKMSFEERKKWRREMVFKALRETFHSLEILESMYKCKVSQVDVRGHQYAIMVDIGSSFEVGKRIDINGFSGIEELVVKNTFSRYGVHIAGIYWRTNDSVNMFTDNYFGVKTARQKLNEDFADTTPIIYKMDNRRIPRPTFSAVSADEERAFMEALQLGLKPPAIHIGNKEYDTDVAPLGQLDSVPFDED